MNILLKTILVFVLGLSTGLILQEKSIFFQPLAELFLTLIKIMAFPMIYFSIAHNLGKAQLKATVVKRFVLLSLTTSLVAFFIGLSLTIWIKPGESVLLTNLAPSLGESRIDYTALALIVSAIISAAWIRRAKKGNGATLLMQFIEWGYTWVFRLAKAMIYVSFVGIFAIIVVQVGTHNIAIGLVLAKVYGVILVAFLLQFIFLILLLKTCSRISIIHFLKASFDYQILAFATGSSKIALPVTIEVSQKKLGISKLLSETLLPIAASCNMNGLSIYLSVVAIFFAQAFNISLGFLDISIIAFFAIIGALGTSGISGGALMILPVVLSAIGIPLEGITLIVVIDPFINAFRTFLNVTGDVVLTACAQTP